MPVLPSSSRFMIALTMLSNSPAGILPASSRAWAISRMTPSLSSASKFARIASRTDKVGKLHEALVLSNLDQPSSARRIHSPAEARCFAGHGLPMTALNLLFVFSNLLFEFLHRAVDAPPEIARLLGGDKIVFMFGIDADIDFRRRLVFQIDGDFDGREPLEVTFDRRPTLAVILAWVAALKWPCRVAMLICTERTPSLGSQSDSLPP